MNSIHRFFSDIYHYKYDTIYKIVDINATFWHREKVYFTFIKSLLWLITVNMNKINPFFSEIYHNKYIKFMKNIAIITLICHGAKCNFTCTSITWYLITVSNMPRNQPVPLGDITPDTQNIMKMWPILAESQILL